MTNATTENLLKNFDLLNLSNLLDDPKNEKYFGKKENMVSVDKPFTSKPFLELIEETGRGHRVWGTKSQVEIEEMKKERLDRYIFVGGFKKISKVPFWMKTYRKDRLSLRNFEKESIKGTRHTGYSSMYEQSVDTPLEMYSQGHLKGTWDNFLPDGFGINDTDDQRVFHETFWDDNFQCFLWFYDKLVKNRKRVA